VGLDWLTCADFSPRVGAPFDLSVPDGTTVALELVEAREGTAPGGVGPDGQERRQFSLLFRGPAAPFQPQGTYRLSHPDMGELDLFLVPIGPDAVGMQYEAVFG
jgi:hypothetical protein